MINESLLKLSQKLKNKEVIEGLKEDPPRKVIWRVPSEGSWYKLGVYQPQKITEYLRSNYRKTGKIEEGIQVWTKKD
ncbi:MAG: hypothetical protein UU29_C0008G0122 [Candidatus Daviesbacteria bacterium GW2011_GWA2_40_9]|uniref:Uncharacterized protein n=1 Tax=Candidatus Daviesbacteria bacterium GW2011_GWA2_40_9 TaxID=1618424 RepID=A0A0G0U1M3_9BACT|nr:MAG: hypothetical protein UU29_C0008G0122 [Candidatus Daviesbacteria bacterium GW2011_GWA2_40_9]